MGSGAIVLAYYGLVRISRLRGLVLALIGLPLLLGVLPGRSVWVDAASCALVVALVVCLRHLADRVSGFAAAIACTPVLPSQIFWSQVMTAVVVFAFQMAAFALTRAIWPGGGV